MLVKRGSRFQGLTPEGEQVLAWARRITGDARTMKEEMRAARQRPVGPAPDRRRADRARHGGQADDALFATSIRASPSRSFQGRRWRS